jgi:uncharacterized protein YqeY
MQLETTIDHDLKAAQLARNAELVSVLRMLKSTFLYAKVAAGGRDTELTDEAIQDILAKEAKKRQESADLYKQGGNDEKAEAELAEKAIIERYLPTQLSEDELNSIIDGVISETGASSPAQMGQVIGAVKKQTGASADGAMVARLVKERLGQ